jgi:transposase
VLLIRMLIVGYCYGIRSELRLCEEVADRLTFRWFCRLDIDDKVPDHSTFSKNRHGRFRDSDVLRHIFERVVLACITAGLVGGEGFAVDASLIEANANKGRSIPGTEWSKERDPATASHAVKEIWRRSTMLPSARRHRSPLSSSRRPILPRSGRGR